MDPFGPENYVPSYRKKGFSSMSNGPLNEIKEVTEQEASDKESLTPFRSLRKNFSSKHKMKLKSKPGRVSSIKKDKPEENVELNCNDMDDSDIVLKSAELWMKNLKLKKKTNVNTVLSSNEIEDNSSDQSEYLSLTDTNIAYEDSTFNSFSGVQNEKICSDSGSPKKVAVTNENEKKESNFVRSSKGCARSLMWRHKGLGPNQDSENHFFKSKFRDTMGLKDLRSNRENIRSDVAISGEEATYKTSELSVPGDGKLRALLKKHNVFPVVPSLATFKEELMSDSGCLDFSSRPGTGNAETCIDNYGFEGKEDFSARENGYDAEEDWNIFVDGGNSEISMENKVEKIEVNAVNIPPKSLKLRNDDDSFNTSPIKIIISKNSPN